MQIPLAVARASERGTIAIEVHLECAMESGLRSVSERQYAGYFFSPKVRAFPQHLLEQNDLASPILLCRFQVFLYIIQLRPENAQLKIELKRQQCEMKSMTKAEEDAQAARKQTARAAAHAAAVAAEGVS